MTRQLSPIAIAVALAASAAPATAQRLGAGGTMNDNTATIPPLCRLARHRSLVEEKKAATPDGVATANLVSS